MRESVIDSYYTTNVGFSRHKAVSSFNQSFLPLHKCLFYHTLILCQGKLFLLKVQKLRKRLQLSSDQVWKFRQSSPETFRSNATSSKCSLTDRFQIHVPLLQCVDNHTLVIGKNEGSL